MENYKYMFGNLVWEKELEEREIKYHIISSFYFNLYSIFNIFQYSSLQGMLKETTKLRVAKQTTPSEKKKMYTRKKRRENVGRNLMK